MNNKKYFSVFFLLTLYVSLFVFSEQVKFGIDGSLSLCIKTVIPSVFPVLLISNTLITNGFPKTIKRLISFPIKHIFGCSENGSMCYLFGLTGGYPVGVKNAKLMLEQNKISREEAVRIASVVVCPGLSFTINVAGAFFGSTKVGLSLLTSTILSAATIGFFTRRKATLPTKAVSVDEEKTLLEAFVLSAEKSVKAVIMICSYIIIFSSLSAVLKMLLPEPAVSIFSVLGEVTGGLQYSSNKHSVILASFVTGFGGFCVIAQVISDAREIGVPMARFIIIRFISGVLSAVYEYITVTVFRLAIPTSVTYETELFSNSFSGTALVIAMTVIMIASIAKNNKAERFI